ncbi:MAG: hypothetical protein KF832_27540 [Caldilineaceae bacterium]|nr:hypothetical protein [Caldilineaceae bacterium]
MVRKLAQSRPAPRFHSLLLGLLALVCAMLAQRQLYDAHFWEAGLLFGCAILLFVIPFRRTLQVALPVAAPWVRGVHSGRRWLWALLPAALAVAATYGSLRTFQTNIERPSLTAWGLHLASLCLLLLFAGLLDWYKPQPPKAERTATNPWRWWQVGALFAILGLAIFLRLWRFAELPFGTWYDEAEAGLMALRILQGDNYWPIYEGSINAPAHYLYLIAFFFHYVDVSTQSIRLVSVVMGVAMVGAAYLAGREFFGSAANDGNDEQAEPTAIDNGRLWGLAFAFLVAVERWGVNFSRIGMYNISTPFFALLTIGLLLRAFRRGRYTDYVLAGLAFGFGLCFYIAFQLFVGVILLFWLLTSLLQRGFLQRTWSGFLLMMVTVALVVMPVVLFAYAKPEIYYARAKGTSIFADKTPLGELPPQLQQLCLQLPTEWLERCQRLPMLLENLRKHLLMFNFQGDPNGRHNLPGEPMVDNLMAALLVLGVGVCLSRFWRPRALLLLIWLGVMLLGGVLSLGFEAPQSLRSIGTLPVAYLLALVPLYALQQAWHKSGGTAYPQYFVVPLCALLLWSGYDNIYTYFYRQANDFASWNAFSTPETIAAEILAGLDDQTEAYVISYFQGHPTLNFLVRTGRPYRRIETTDHLPLAWPEGKNVVLILNADSRSIFDEAKRYYPAARFEEIGPPSGAPGGDASGGPPVVYAVYLTQADLQSVQGLQARYYALPPEQQRTPTTYPDATWSGIPLLERKELTIQADWATQLPVPLPFAVEWEGVLNVKDYGTHQFFVQAPAYAALYIGEQQVVAGEGALTAALVLAEGQHNVRLRAIGAAAPFSLAWRPPDRGPEIIPAAALYIPPVTSNGLLGQYYPNGDWQGPPALERIDPALNLYFHIPTLVRPYTVEWRGKIAIPQSGNYRFGLESIDETTLWIDEQEVVTTHVPNAYREGAIQLENGLHDIRIRYADRTDHTHINLYWVPPFAGQQPVPSEVLFPPQGNYARVTVPDLLQLLFDPNAPAPPAVSGQPLGGIVRPVAAGLNQPKGIAVGPDDRLYVADTGNRRVLVMAPDGTTLGELYRPDAFVEPFDVAVGPQGQVYVLDAVAERISIFDRDDSYLGELPVDPAMISRSRGLYVDSAGLIWVANTPGGRVLALNHDGAVVLSIPVWPGEDSQPVDVVVGTDGSIFVTDAGLNKLVRFDASGRRLLAWDIPVANTIDSSHLAVDAAGFLYMSKPEPFLITQLLPSGELVGDWSALPVGGGPVKPVGIAVDSRGRVWYVDTVGGVVYVIEPDVG